MSDLFIIGAGASVPYGFPSGESLFNEIRKLNYSINYKDTSNKTLQYDRSKYFKNSPSHDIQNAHQQMYNFSIDVKKSSMISIDDFLRNRKKLDDIQNKFGKMIIADKILQAEKKSKTNIELMTKIDWFNYLFSYIDRDDSLFNDFLNNSKFITFNYDRLLENKILEFLQHDKNCKNDEIFRNFEKIEIIHVNGSIGNLKDIEFGKDKEVIGSWEDSDEIHPNYEYIIKNMKTIWEYDDKGREQEQKRIIEIFDKSKRVFFIGFGWLEDNMKLLGLDNREKKILSGKKIYGTAFKMSDYNIRNIENRLKLCGALQPNIKDCEAVDLIKDFF
jgi:hypothetical protein